MTREEAIAVLQRAFDALAEQPPYHPPIHIITLTHLRSGVCWCGLPLTEHQALAD